MREGEGEGCSVGSHTLLPLPHYIIGLIASGLKLVRVSVRNREK